jgi:hypothetical protein
MLQFIQTSEGILKNYIDEFFSRKLIYNNYFGIDLTNSDCFRTKGTLIIRKRYDSFFRVYILSDNKESLTDSLQKIGRDHVINIPSKGEITLWETILSQSNFQKIAVYIRMYNKTFERRGEFIECYAVESDIKQIRDILYEVFSPITGWLPDNMELMQMISNKQVFVDRDEKGISSVLVFTVKNRKIEFRAWASLRGHGLFLFYNAFNLMAELGVYHAYLWTNENNHKAKRIYELLGFERDGLKDYIFVKDKEFVFTK